jgi:hypothetical protein
VVPDHPQDDDFDDIPFEKKAVAGMLLSLLLV